MFGTIARFRLIPGKEQELHALFQEYRQANLPGLVAEYIYRADADANTYFMAVIFESRAAYVANADSPEQDARYRKFRALLAQDPEWNDGEIVDSLVAA
jgi:quinol monooxygenase YgiN